MKTASSPLFGLPYRAFMIPSTLQNITPFLLFPLPMVFTFTPLFLIAVVHASICFSEEAGFLRILRLSPSPPSSSSSSVSSIFGLMLVISTSVYRLPWLCLSDLSFKSKMYSLILSTKACGSGGSSIVFVHSSTTFFWKSPSLA